MNNQPHWFYFYIMPLMPTVLTIAGWFFINHREKSKRRHSIKQSPDAGTSGACRIERRLEEMAKVILFLFLLLVCSPAY
ncbi:hypothetical protein [Neisseria meningitidis]|uniref:hypothetical protein n=1 Tax=Neisseria meningitidis TaxID=487 RepID=UPI000766CE29|nr:hypothetical protein [Neisseria meningitidis]CWN46310.1 Uncharacterised protein [Neisseria meningitidis]CWR19959.1 Uncharacterised protein [Neisseria meningitidis]